ncbi:MAG: zinc ribbon domain-containing protein [Promethearchaeia archaeon]
MSEPEEGTPIIIDVGSAYVKVGYAGDSEPRYIFPCITGTEKYQTVMVDVDARNLYVGNDAMNMRGVLKLERPIERGQIQDWNDYYEILNHIFYNLLRLESVAEYPVIYVEHPFVAKETKEYIARVLFETHSVKSLVMVPSPLLSMFSIGLTTGLVVESGDGVTWTVPIIDGQIMEQATQRLYLAGIDVNHNFKSLLMREGINLDASALEQIIQEIKEKNCYMVLDPDNPNETRDALEYSMPDGSIIQIPNHILYEAPEVLFQPGMLGYNMKNITQATIYSLQMMEKTYWGDLLSHIVLSGGNLSYSGFTERFKQELKKSLPQLGPIPKPAGSKEIGTTQEKQGLQPVEGKEKKTDTCPKCGELIDLSDDNEFCPQCGAKMKIPKIPIAINMEDEKGAKKEETPEELICPHCNKKITDSTSRFCPYCGKNIPEEPDLGPVEEKVEKAPEAKEFTGFYEESENIIKFYIPENLQTSIFDGASILGSLPSFQRLFITQEDFQQNKDLLYRDISEIL